MGKERGTNVTDIDENVAKTSDQRVLAVLHRMIVDHKLKAGDKISEVQVATMLNVSRTPARLALKTLEVEGLIKKRRGRGFTVQAIQMEDIADGFEVRGVLEGLGARVMAKRGASDEAIKLLTHCVDAIDAILDGDKPADQKIADYQEMNTQFHEAIMDNCGNTYVRFVFARLEKLPMLKLGTVIFNNERQQQEIMRLRLGNLQHRLILHAITKRDGQRAETMMREHVNQTLLYSEILSS